MANSIVLNTIYKAIDRFSAPLQKMAAGTTTFGLKAEASIGKLDAGFSKAYAATNNFTDKIFNLKNALMGLAAVEIGKTIFHEVEKIAESQEKLSEGSKKLGISAQQLKELKYVGQIQNIDPEYLATKMDFLNKNLGAAKMGYGSLFTMLKKTDPALLAQVKRAGNVNEVMDIFAKTMDKIPSASKRAALATAAFGKGGADMIKFFAGGTEEINGLKKEVQGYGITSEETVERAEKLLKTQRKLTASFDMLKVSILTQLVPVLQGYLDMAMKWLQSHREIIKVKVLEFIKQMKDLLSALMPILKFIVNHFKLIIVTIINFIALSKGLLLISMAIKSIRYSVFALNVVQGVWFAFTKAMPAAMFANKAAMIGFNLAMKAQLVWSGLITAAQWAFNAALWACPLTWIVAAILAVIAAIVLMIIYWKDVKKWIDKFSNSAVGQILLLIFPIGKVIEFISFMSDRWKGIKKAFTDGGFIAGIKAIGEAILSFVLKPFELIIKAIEKITGLNLGGKAIENFRASLDKDLLEKQVAKSGENTILAPVNPKLQNQSSDLNFLNKNVLDISLNNKTNTDVDVRRNNAAGVRLSPNYKI